MLYPFMTLNDGTEIAYYQDFLESVAHIILELAGEGGLEQL